MSNEMHITAGRCYYEKRVGWRWEVWFQNSDGSADSGTGATEWRALSTRFWRRTTAASVANEIWCAFNDGVWVANCRHADAEFAKTMTELQDCSGKEATAKKQHEEISSRFGMNEDGYLKILQMTTNQLRSFHHLPPIEE